MEFCALSSGYGKKAFTVLWMTLGQMYRKFFFKMTIFPFKSKIFTVHPVVRLLIYGKCLMSLRYLSLLDWQSMVKGQRITHHG